MSQPVLGTATIQQQIPIASPTALGACLVQMSPSDQRLDPIRLELPQVTVGRSAGCHLVLDDPSVSRLHAEIVHAHGEYEVRDLGSTNGTLVNDESISNHQLTAGDLIQFGDHTFKYLSAVDTARQYDETLYTLMTRDGLTGTINKRLFDEMLERDLSRCMRNEFPLSVLFFDVDHFKTINNQFGQATGNEVLRQIANRILNVARVEDLVARVDGDRFAMSLMQTTVDDAMTLAERIRAEIADVPFPTKAGPVHVTVSIGVAELAELVKASATALCELAAERHYMAKRSGRNQIRP